MANLFISLVLLLLSFETFAFTTQLGTLNRTLFNLPKSLFENAIVLIQKEETPYVKPYFDSDKLEYYLTSYLSDSFSNLYLTYEVTFSYYQAADKTMCRSDKCDGVEVSFETKILEMFPYQKTVFYEVQNNNE